MVKKSPKLSIIVSSDKLDKLYPAVILASTATAMDWEAELFFTFWGLLALKKGYEPSEISLDYAQYKDALIKSVESGSMPKWKNLIKEGKEKGKLKVYACSTTMGVFNIKKEDLEDFVDGILGAASFLSKAKNSQVTLFIA